MLLNPAQQKQLSTFYSKDTKTKWRRIYHGKVGTRAHTYSKIPFANARRPFACVFILMGLRPEHASFFFESDLASVHFIIHTCVNGCPPRWTV